MRIAVLIAFSVQFAFAQTTVGLKDVYSSYFKFGSILNGTTANNSAMKTIVLKEFNSITPENELKPDATLVQSGSTNDDIKVELKSGAKAILQFCQDNSIPVRGHTLVWHSQTPQWFFKDNFQNSGNWVTPAVMDKRMESYIKNMFALIESSYPNLNLYAYDVVNEAASDAGAPRTAGTDAAAGQSMWVQVYGNNSFIEKAFIYARKYAPATTKLFYNDYNEYMGAKRDYIASSIVKPLYDKGLLDGMGMQSHLDIRQGSNAFPSVSDYGTAIKKYKDIGVEIHVTELDAGMDAADYNATTQATYYKNIMNEIITKGGSAVTAVVVWGIQDDQSWRKARKPLLFDDSGNKKPAYTSVVSLVPESEWGKPNSSIGVACDVKNLASSYAAGSSIPRPNVICGNRTAAGTASFSSGSDITGWNSPGGTHAFYNTGTRIVTLNSVECGGTKVTFNPAISCGNFEVVTASSSSSNNDSSSSSDDDTSPILSSQLSTLNSQPISYYSLKGEPLGNAKPQRAGVYIVKQGHSVKKIVVRQ
jgi:GH35 family endo-1,4-beta-xylanase